MNIKLVKEVQVPLLARKRLSFEIDYPGSKTPSKDEIKKTIAGLQKVKEELVSVRHIYPRFGKCKAKIITHIYNKVEDLKKYEPTTKKEKKKEETPKEAPKAESAPAEQPKEEKKEEVKEEKPAEEKPKEE